jgi:hypothetical protein
MQIEDQRFAFSVYNFIKPFFFNSLEMQINFCYCVENFLGPIIGV